MKNAGVLSVTVNFTQGEVYIYEQTKMIISIVPRESLAEIAIENYRPRGFAVFRINHNYPSEKVTINTKRIIISSPKEGDNIVIEFDLLALYPIGDSRIIVKVFGKHEEDSESLTVEEEAEATYTIWGEYTSTTLDANSATIIVEKNFEFVEPKDQFRISLSIIGNPPESMFEYDLLVIKGFFSDLTKYLQAYWVQDNISIDLYTGDLIVKQEKLSPVTPIKINIEMEIHKLEDVEKISTSARIEEDKIEETIELEAGRVIFVNTRSRRAIEANTITLGPKRITVSIRPMLECKLEAITTAKGTSITDNTLKTNKVYNIKLRITSRIEGIRDARIDLSDYLPPDTEIISASSEPETPMNIAGEEISIPHLPKRIQLEIKVKPKKEGLSRGIIKITASHPNIQKIFRLNPLQVRGLLTIESIYHEIFYSSLGMLVSATIALVVEAIQGKPISLLDPNTVMAIISATIIFLIALLWKLR